MSYNSKLQSMIDSALQTFPLEINGTWINPLLLGCCYKDIAEWPQSWQTAKTHPWGTIVQIRKRGNLDHRSLALWHAKRRLRPSLAVYLLLSTLSLGSFSRRLRFPCLQFEWKTSRRHAPVRNSQCPASGHAEKVILSRARRETHRQEQSIMILNGQPMVQGPSAPPTPAVINQQSNVGLVLQQWWL